MQLKERSVCLGVRNDEDHDVHLPVPLLESELAFQGLSVPQPGLAFAASLPWPKEDHSVPCTAVTWNRQRDLGSPDRPSREPDPEPFEHREVTCVPGGVTVWKCSNGNPETDGRCGPAGLIQREAGKDSALDPSKLRMRHVRSRTRCGLADPGTKTRVQDLGTELGRDVTGRAAASSKRLIPRRHQPSLDVEPSPSVIA
jgi:hypothetical protein